MRNQRELGGVSARSVALAAGLVFSLSAVSAEAQQAATLTSTSFNALWSNPQNWSPSVVPINSGTTRYLVVIGDNRSVVIDSTMPANFSVNSITLSPSARIEVTGGRTLQVTSESTFRGLINATNGSVIVTRPPEAPLETNLNFSLNAGSGGLYRSAGSGFNLLGVSLTTTAGGTLDLRSMLSLSLPATAQGGTSTSQISANGGTIDLSGVFSLQTNPGSRVQVRAANTGSILLSSLTSLENVDLDVNNATVQLGALTSINNSSIIWSAGTFTLPSAVSAYSSTSSTVFRVGASGNVLNLSPIQTMNVASSLTLESLGGRLDLSNARITQTTGNPVLINASAGGTIDLSSVTSLRNAQILATGANSRVELPLLTGIQSNVVINASSGGSISAPLLTDFLNAQITNSGGTLVIGRPTSFVNSTLSINSGTVDFAPTLTQINWNTIPTPTPVNNVFLRAFNGATIRGEGVERIDIGLTSGFSSLTSALTVDTGGIIALPAVSTIQTFNGTTFSVSAAGGGRILLPSVTNLSSFQSITLAGTGSVVDLRNASTRTGTSTFTLTSTNQGVLELPALATIEASTLNLTANTGGTIRLPLTLPSPSRSTVIDIRSGGRVELPQYTGLTDLRVTIADPQSALVIGSFNEFERSTLSVTNASFLIPQTITRISGPNSTSSTVLEAVNNASITAPGVTTLEFGSSQIDTSEVILRAASSSLIDLPRWTTQINRLYPRLRFEANSSSTIRAGALTSLIGAYSIIATDGSTIDLSSVTNANGSISVSAGPLSTIDLSALTIYTNFQSGGISAREANSRILANNLRTLGPGTRSLTFRAQAGGNLQLASLQSLGSSTDTRFDISAATLQLPSLNDLGEGSGRNFTASQGGRIELPLLTTLGSVSNVEFSTTFANSRISLPALQSLGTGSGRVFRAESTSTISAPLLTRLDGADVILIGGASLQTGTLTSIDNATFSISDPTFTIPTGITSYTARGRGQVDLITVNFGTFSAPSLTSLTIGSDATPRTVQSIVCSNGQINLSGVSSLPRINGGVLRLDVGSVVNLGSMNRLNGVDLTLRSGGNLITAPLQSIDGSSISVTNRSYTLSNLITEYSTLDRRSMPLFSVSGSGTLLDLTSLRTLRFGTADSPGQTYGVGSGSVIDLSGLTSLQSVNGGRLSFGVSNGSSIRLTGLTSINDTDLNIFGSTSQVQLGAVTGFSNSTVRAESGGRFVLPAGVTSYQNETGGQLTLFSTNFAGSSIDLSPLRSLTFGSTRVANSEYTINSQFGGSINLSGLTSLTRVNGGILNLFATGGALTLPSVPAFNYVNFSFLTTNLVLPNTVTNIDESTFAVNGATLTVPSHIQSLSITDRGSVTALRASGTTGRINAESLTTLRLGSTSTPNAQMTIQTENGGAIDLRNVTSIELLNNASLSISITGTLNIDSVRELENTSIGIGGVINASALTLVRRTSFSGSMPPNALPSTFPSLQTIDARNSPGFQIMAFNAGRFIFPSLDRIMVGSSTVDGAEQRIRTFGAAIEFGSPIVVESANQGRLIFEMTNTGSITMPTATVSPTSTILMQSISSTNAGLRLSGALNIVSTNPSDFRAQSGFVSFIAGSGLIHLEAAGANLGTAANSLTNFGNFGIGQLRIGVTGGPPISVLVSDLFNNGQRGTTGREALYLFGVSNFFDSNGLVLLSGSRLIIDDSADVFALRGGVMINLRSLIPAGATQVAFGGGFIVIPTPAAGVLLGLSTLLATRRKRSN